MKRRQRTNLLAGTTAAFVLAAVFSAAAAAPAGSSPGPAIGQEASQKQKAKDQGKDRSGTQPAVQQAKKEKKDPAVKFAEAWPDAAKLHERKIEAENRPLFAALDPIAVTLKADFKLVNKDRDPKSTKTYPGELTVPASGGATKVVKATIGGRGNLRRKPQVCDFIPIRLTLEKDEVAGTAFDGIGRIKLVTHCQGDYEHLVLGEYLAYRLFNLFTPESFRARLAKVSYTDPKSGKAETRWGMFIEDDDDVARRMEGRIVGVTNKLFQQMVPDVLLRMMVLQYMVGNTDLSIIKLHNVRLIQTPQELRLYPISYDFDLAGLVNGPYGAPDSRLGITSIRQRLYRGPCVSAEEMEPILAGFRAKKAEALALVDAVPDMDRKYRQEAREYLEEFFSTINNKGATKRAFVDNCKKQISM